MFRRSIGALNQFRILLTMVTSLKKLYSWLFSFGSLTAAWLYRCFVMEEFRVIDIVYHFLISMALIYFGIPSSGEWLIFVVIVVEFGAVKIIVDSSNKDA